MFPHTCLKLNGNFTIRNEFYVSVSDIIGPLFVTGTQKQCSNHKHIAVPNTEPT